MIPSMEKTILGASAAVKQAELPSETYQIDFSAGKISGRVSGLNAMRQAIHKILRTQRFSSLLYSWDYGSEMNQILGKDFRVAESETKRLLREALMQDDRITEIQSVAVERSGRRSVKADFTVVTIFGTLREEAVLNG